MASHGIPRAATNEPRSEQKYLKEQKQIQEYKELVGLIEKKAANREYTLELLNLTSKLLRQNPEYNTVWNVRRRLLISGLFSSSSDVLPPSKDSQRITETSTITTSSDNSSSSASPAATEHSLETPLNPAAQTPGKNGTTLDLIKSDLEFLVPLLMEYPKCYWIWNYRYWLLQEANNRFDVGTVRELWNRELALVGKMLTIDNRNFHGWGYRRKIVAQLESPAIQGQSMVEAEFAYTTKMIQISLANFSAWHHRSKLIPRLLNERGADDRSRKKFLDDEFDLITQAIYTDAFPYAQSVWFYHQFLMTTLVDPAEFHLITPGFSRRERINYIAQQLDDLEEMLEGAEDCKWIYIALIEYSLASFEMNGSIPDEPEAGELRTWLGELRTLDPEKAGRWDDMGTLLASRGL